jgi:hypothetical protein
MTIWVLIRSDGKPVTGTHYKQSGRVKAYTTHKGAAIGAGHAGEGVKAVPIEVPE